ISQSFDFPTAYVARHRALKAETAVERSRFELSVNEVKREIASLYYNMLYAQENIRIRQMQDTIYRKFLTFASARYRSGETNRLEQINAERFYNDNRIALQQAEQEFKRLQLAMQQWLNSDDRIIPKEQSLPIIEMNDAGISEWNVLQSPQNRLFENQLLWSKQNVSLQRQSFVPTLNFAVRAQCLIKGFNPYHINREPFPNGNFTGFEVGITLPLFFGEQRANLIAAKKELAIAETVRKNSLLQLSKENERYLNEYRQAKSVIDYYTNTATAQAQEMAKLSQLSYQKGEIGYIEYMQNQQSVVDTYQQYAQAVNHYNQIVIMLNFLQGDKDEKSK
ncbi:MAG: TolC family protein, partial [Bacteroidales bacterium]|nr:TolC family protein [Bacteroidales bacterium]